MPIFAEALFHYQETEKALVSAVNWVGTCILIAGLALAFAILVHAARPRGARGRDAD